MQTYTVQNRTVASVENVPNSGVSLGAHDMQHSLFKFYVPVNVVIWELLGGIEKKTCEEE